MPISAIYDSLNQIAQTEFPDIVVSSQIVRLPTDDPQKLRLHLTDGSLIDVYLSVTGRYSYHWERRLIGKGDLYRHDNAPHKAWRHLRTFPRHFHDGTERNVVESHISSNPEEALREFCTFARRKLLSEA